MCFFLQAGQSVLCWQFSVYEEIKANFSKPSKVIAFVSYNLSIVAIVVIIVLKYNRRNWFF